MTETPQKTWTAEDWAKSVAAAENAIAAARDFRDSLEAVRPRFPIDRGYVEILVDGRLMVSGPTFKAILTADEARDLARWIGEVFPGPAKPLAVVRDYEPSGRCHWIDCEQPVAPGSIRGCCSAHEDANG